MKAAMRQVEEINRLKAAIKKTDSKYLKRDYKKSLCKIHAELKIYCSYRGLDYNKIIMG